MIVAIIRDSGRGTHLVQWREGNRLKRAWVPSRLVGHDLEVSAKTLRESPPYGLPFEDALKSVTIAAEDVAEALHRRNIWTFEDVQKNPDSVSKALIAAAELSVSRIQNSLREFLAAEVQSDGSPVESNNGR